MRFINLTPHPINLPKGTIPTSGEVARVETTHKVQSAVDFIPESWVPGADGPQPVQVELMDTVWGRVLHLPDFKHGTYLIVSSQVVVAAYLAGRRIDDLLCPGAQKRGGQGQIIGAGGLTTGRSCIPGEYLGLRAPQIAVFGSAAVWAAKAERDRWLTLPGDIDAVYAGVDRDEAEHRVRAWANSLGLPDRIPLDLHHSPHERTVRNATGVGLSIPRPKPLPGEDGTVPPDSAWARVLGDGPVMFDDVWTLAAMFRRLDRILEHKSRDPQSLPRIVRTVFDHKDRHFALSLDTRDSLFPDYAEGTLGAARRAFARLGEVGPWLLGQFPDRLGAALAIVLNPDWTPPPAVTIRAVNGAGRMSPSKESGVGVLFVSGEGVLPGYPQDNLKRYQNPAWLLGQV